MDVIGVAFSSIHLYLYSISYNPDYLETLYRDPKSESQQTAKAEKKPTV